jgi:phytoene dehydrogenase-like protein
MEDYDVVIIGAGHNGLVCAAYLLKAGYQVLLLERQSIPGGAATTEELMPDVAPNLKFSPIMSLFISAQSFKSWSYTNTG